MLGDENSHGENFQSGDGDFIEPVKGLFKRV